MLSFLWDIVRVVLAAGYATHWASHVMFHLNQGDLCEKKISSLLYIWDGLTDPYLCSVHIIVAHCGMMATCKRFVLTYLSCFHLVHTILDAWKQHFPNSVRKNNLNYYGQKEIILWSVLIFLWFCLTILHVNVATILSYLRMYRQTHFLGFVWLAYVLYKILRTYNNSHSWC